MEKKEHTRRMAIITESACWDGAREEEGKTVFNLVMICTSGEDSGKEFEKRYVFREDPPEFLRHDLLLMGYIVQSVSDLKEMADQLVGVIVRVSLVKDGDTFRVYIDDYFGRDNPKKYKVNR